MSARRVANFLLLRPAFSRRNFTSLFLVGVFVGVYIMSGGKISTAVPRYQDQGTFGGGATVPGEAPATAPVVVDPEVAKQDALKQLGVVSSEDREARQDTINKRGRLFDGEEEAVEQPIDKSGLIKGVTGNEKEELKLRKQEKRRTDSFSMIEERLNIKRK